MKWIIFVLVVTLYAVLGYALNIDMGSALYGYVFGNIALATLQIDR